LRRKVLQDFANTFCQQFLDLGSGHDVATFVRLGSGSYSMNLLTGECMQDGTLIPNLKVCQEYRRWLAEQLVQHRIPPGLRSAALTVDVLVRRASVRESYGHHFGSADLEFQCRAELETDERVYRGEQSGSRSWGYTPDQDGAAT
jgi:hypothetical protein